jgi:hypothetical protein
MAIDLAEQSEGIGASLSRNGVPHLFGSNRSMARNHAALRGSPGTGTCRWLARPDPAYATFACAEVLTRQ